MRPVPATEKRYIELLLAHLHDQPRHEALFFANARRFDLLENHIGALLRRPDLRVLNVASGPFALEYYLPGRAAHIHSVDLDPSLAALHEQMLAEGLIANSSFTESDVLAYEPEGQFDAVIINDLFYSRHVDFYAVFEKYRRHVSPGGVLYFDILDKKAGTIWQAFGKDSRYRRYCLDSVRRTLGEGGYSIEAEAPSPGIKGGIDMALRKLLWRGLGIANNLIFVSRRRSLFAGLFAAVMSFAGMEFFSERERHAHAQVLAATTSSA